MIAVLYLVESGGGVVITSYRHLSYR